MPDSIVTQPDLSGALPLVARGKVRDLYKIDDRTLLFVATDRISAYDVIMENVAYPLALLAEVVCIDIYSRAFQRRASS